MSVCGEEWVAATLMANAKYFDKSMDGTDPKKEEKKKTEERF